MSELSAVWGLARSEARLLRRTWKFWILVVLGFLYLTAVNLYYSWLHNFYSGYSGTVGLISAGIVLQIVYSQFNLLFGVFLIWFCYDFQSKDRKGRVEEVLLARPPGTFSLVLGKFLGVLLPAFGLALVLSLLTLALRFIPWFRIPFRLGPYLLHLFLLTLPATAFVIALVFFLTLLTRSRAAAIVIAHAYVILIMVVFISMGRWIRPEYAHLADYSGYALTTFHSDLIGFTDLGKLFLQRGYVVALTFLFLALTAALYPRLREERRLSRAVTSTLAVTAGLAILYLGYGLWSGHHEKTLRGRAQAEQEALVDRPPTRVAHYDIDLDLTGRKTLAAQAAMRVRNEGERPQDVLTFVLNSGLEVESVTSEGGGPLEFERGLTTLSVRIPPLAPGGETTIRAAWRGPIAQSPLFLGSKTEMNELVGNERNMMAVAGYLASWVSPRCTFLVPEARWYPSPNVDYGWHFPEKRPVNFATAELRVTLPPGRLAVSQGRMAGREEAPGGGGTYRFVVEEPVPGFSVNAGRYSVRQGTIGGIPVALYYAERHAPNIDFFGDAGDEIREELEKRLEKVRENTGLAYPYPSLSLVEVPSAMRSYSEGWDSPNVMSQPGVLMLKESGFFGANFERAYRSREKAARDADEDPDAGKIKVGLLTLFFDLDIVGGSLLENLMPNFWGFRLDAVGPLYPLAGFCLDQYLKELATGVRPFRSVWMMKNFGQLIGQGIQAHFARELSWQEAFYGASKDLEKIYEAMKKTPLLAFEPGDDPGLFYDVMSVKGRGFVVTLREVLGEEGFRRLTAELLARHRGAQYTFEDLRQVAGEVSGEDLGWLFEQWTRRTDLPGYRIVSAEAYRLAGGEAPRYQVKVQVANEEEARGFAVLTLETKDDKVERRLRFGGKETVEVAAVLADEPKRVVLDPLLAMNRDKPRKTLRLPEEPVAAEPLEAVSVVAAAGSEALTVTVDDLDEGFSLAGVSGGGLLRFGGRGKAGKEGEKPSLPDYNFGVPREWQNWIHDDAWGLYDRTAKVKRGGEGKFSATWKARIPERGRWEVLVYIGIGGDKLRAGKDSQKLGSDYRYTLTHEDGTTEVKLDAQNAERGWNSLGVFSYTRNGEALVTLTDQTDGAVVADAVKWVLKEGGAGQ